MSKKHLVFIGNTAWSMFNFRGVLLSYLLNKGYSISVVSPRDPIFQEKIKELGCECISLPIKSKGINPIIDILLIYRFWKLFCKLKPDFCFFYTIKPNIYGSIAAYLSKTPHIAITTGLGYIFLSSGWISKIAKRMYSFAFRFPKEIWFLNQDDLSIFCNTKIVRKNKAHLLKGEGIDLSAFSPHYNINFPISFLLMARMLKDKGIIEFVNAAKKLKSKYPDVHFKLLGFIGVDNPSSISKEEIMDWEKQGFIEYLGTTIDVRPYIEKATCIVLPSYREGIPRCLLEGASMGKPIITTRTVGCLDTIDNDITGFLCEPKDVESLRDAMEKIILMNSSDLQRMGKAGRQKMEREFDIKYVINEYVNTLKKYNIIP